MNSTDRHVILGILIAVVGIVTGTLFFGAPAYEVVAYEETYSLRKVEGLEPDGSTVTVDPILMGGVDPAGKLQQLAVDSAGNMLSKPFLAIIETGITEIIGVDEQAAQYDWSTGTQVALGGTYSGEILNVTLILSGSLSEAGTLLIFDADPSVTLADANLATASWLLAIGKYDVAAGDWFEENAAGTGGVATFAEPVAFHALSSFWVAYYHEGTTQWNSAAGDDESLSIQIEYRRDS